MKRFLDKPCRNCGKVFQPAAPCNLYCGEDCAAICRKIATRKASFKHWVKVAIETGRESAIGVGRGGNTARFKDDNQYKNGTGQFKRLKPTIKAVRRYCERCLKDLISVNSWSWCVHHRDHDRANNVIENLELLCKRCHQMEHKCWKAFEGATTIPRGSTPKQAEAPDTQTG